MPTRPQEKFTTSVGVGKLVPLARNKPCPLYDLGGACFQAGGGFGLAVLAVTEGAPGLAATFAFFGFFDSRLLRCSRLAIGFPSIFAPIRDRLTAPAPDRHFQERMIYRAQPHVTNTIKQ